MATLPSTNMRAILKDIVAKKMAELTFRKHEVLTALSRDGEDVKETVPGHYEWFNLVRLSGPQGGKVLRPSDRTFATHSPHGQDHRIGFKMLTSSWKIWLSKDMIKKADNNPEAAAAYAMRETNETTLSMKMEIDAILHTGVRGRITMASGAQSAAVVPVDDVNLLDSMIGAYVKIVTPNTAPTGNSMLKTHGQELYIVSVDYDNKTVTLSDTPVETVADNDWIMRYDCPISGYDDTDGFTYPQQFGFPDLMSNSRREQLVDTDNFAYFGADRTAYPRWQGQQKSFTGKVFNFHFLKNMLDLVKNRSMGEINWFLINTNTETEYVNQWYARYNVQPPTMDVDGGYGKATKFTAGAREIPITVSKKVPDADVWGLDRSSFGIKHLSDPYWSETDGQVLIPSETEDIAYAILKYDWQLVGYAPGQNCRGYGFEYTVDTI